jgi:hypothetical protein
MYRDQQREEAWTMAVLVNVLDVCGPYAHPARKIA